VTKTAPQKIREMTNAVQEAFNYPAIHSQARHRHVGTIIDELRGVHPEIAQYCRKLDNLAQQYFLNSTTRRGDSADRIKGEVYEITARIRMVPLEPSSSIDKT